MKDLHPSVLETISQDQVDNLVKLADFLDKHIPPPTFSMDCYISVVAFPVTAKEHYNECGTTACAVGHGPLAGIVPLEYESWNDYSERNFGCGPCNNWKVFEWLFGNGWTDIDNTPRGAVSRIEWYLENGLPSDWEDQLHGHVPLCYEYEEPTI